MSNHFIKNIEIKNFKCFENFKAEGFGRVNLIGGKNNVGKTTLLEALYINLNGTEKHYFLNSLFRIIQKRDNFFFDNNISDKNMIESYKILFTIKSHTLKNYKPNEVNYISSNHHQVNFEFKDTFTGLKINYQIDNKESDENIAISLLKDIFRGRIKTEDNIIFVKPIGLYNEKIIELFANVQLLDKEDELNNFLNLFDNDIREFKIINQEPKVYSKNLKDYISLTQLGDGIKSLINIFISIYSVKDGYLFIDEIENGIHYTKLDELWKLILKISKEQNVQVFATTHSRECIESFNRVQLKRKEENKDTYYFEIIKNIKTDKVFMRKLDSNQLEYELIHKGEFRG